MTDYLASERLLIGQLQRGRGCAFQRLAELSSLDAQAAIVECVKTLDRPTDMVTHVCGYADAIVDLRLAMHDWYSWLTELPRVSGGRSPREGLMFVATLLAELVKAGVPGGWQCLQKCLSRGDNWKEILSYTCDLLPDDVLVRLIPRLDDEELLEICDVHDPRWFRLSRMCERVRLVVPGVDTCIGGASLEYSESAYVNAPLSQRRFALVRYAVSMSLECVDDLLFEGLWDANPRAQLMSVELIDIGYPGARSRLDALQMSRSRPVVLAAARRLRSVDDDCWGV